MDNRGSRSATGYGFTLRGDNGGEPLTVEQKSWTGVFIARIDNEKIVEIRPHEGDLILRIYPRPWENPAKPDSTEAWELFGGRG